MLKSSLISTISLKFFFAKSFKPSTRTRQFSFISCNTFNYCQQNYNWTSFSAAPQLLQTQNIQYNKFLKNYENFYSKNLANQQNHVIFIKHFSTSKFLFNEKRKKCDKKGSLLSECPPPPPNKNVDDVIDIPPQLGLFAKFKIMYKKYWYVLIPVHVVTSIGWFGGFYYLSTSGVDIPALLESLYLSETIVDKFKNNRLGHFAIAYLCYKIATPVRYAITLGGTTVCIRNLVKGGYIKPMPTKKELLKMYEDNKPNRTKKNLEK